MRLLLLAWIALALVLTPVRAESPADAAAVIAKAVQAVGGEEKLARVKAQQVKIKGTLYDLDGATFAGEIITQLPEQFRYTVQADVGGTKVPFTQVLSRNQGWTRIDGELKAADPPSLAEMRVDAYVDYLCHLLSLLRDKNLTLSLTGETKVRDRPANKVKVAAAGKPDVFLSFDAESGLLVKTEYRGKDSDTKQEVLHEEYLSDYRPIDPGAADEVRLRAAKVDSSGPALLDFLRRQTLTEANRAKISGLIRDLGASAYQTREQAQRELIAWGSLARPALEEAVKGEDVEVVSRARLCLKQIGKADDPTLAPAALRLVALRKPVGAAEVLLAYLAGIPSEEAEAALAAVAFRDGNPDPVLVRASAEKDSPTRAFALAALRDGKDPTSRAGRRIYIDGLRRAMKGVHYRNGKKSSEWEITDVQFFSRFEDKEFSRP